MIEDGGIEARRRHLQSPILYFLSSILRSPGGIFLLHFPSACAALLLASTGPSGPTGTGPVRTFLIPTNRDATATATTTAVILPPRAPAGQRADSSRLAGRVDISDQRTPTLAGVADAGRVDAP